MFIACYTENTLDLKDAGIDSVKHTSILAVVKNFIKNRFFT